MIFWNMQGKIENSRTERCFICTVKEVKVKVVSSLTLSRDVMDYVIALSEIFILKLKICMGTRCSCGCHCQTAFVFLQVVKNKKEKLKHDERVVRGAIMKVKS